MKKVILVILAACMMCCCFVSCNNPNDDTEQQVKYVLYCGLNDADAGSQVLTVAEAQEDARKIITDKGFGYTEYVTYGAYTENGTVKGNDTLVYVLFYVEEADAKDIAADIKEELGLASVLVEEVQNSYDFAE